MNAAGIISDVYWSVTGMEKFTVEYVFQYLWDHHGIDFYKITPGWHPSRSRNISLYRTPNSDTLGADAPLLRPPIMRLWPCSIIVEIPDSALTLPGDNPSAGWGREGCNPSCQNKIQQVWYIWGSQQSLNSYKCSQRMFSIPWEHTDLTPGSCRKHEKVWYQW